MQKNIKNGFILAKAITKQHAKTFHFASLFLPKDKRNAAYSVYAICRLTDDAVDASINPKTKLDQIRAKIDLAYQQNPLTDDLLSAFRCTVITYKIPKAYFEDLLLGMEMDLTKNRYRDFNELRLYCYRVAGVIGLIMLKIFGATDPKALEYAVDLGIAMQLTNILRDIEEDYSRGRIYLPQDELVKFDLSEQTIAKKSATKEFKQFMLFNITRAQSYYQNAKQGINLISNLSCRFVVKIMAILYSKILVDIKNHDYNVFGYRARVCGFKKILTVLTLGLTHENKHC